MTKMFGMKDGVVGQAVICTVVLKGSDGHPQYSLTVLDSENKYWQVQEARFLAYRKARLSLKKGGIRLPDNCFPDLFAKARFGSGLKDTEIYSRRDGLEAFFGHIFAEADELSTEQRTILCTCLPFEAIDAARGTKIRDARKGMNQSEEEEEKREMVHTPLTFLQKMSSSETRLNLKLLLNGRGKHPLYEVEIIDRETELVFVKSRFVRFAALKDYVYDQAEGEALLQRAPNFPARKVKSRFGLGLSATDLEDRRKQLEVWCHFVFFQLFPALPASVQLQIITTDLPVHTFAAVVPSSSTTTTRDPTTLAAAAPAPNQAYDHQQQPRPPTRSNEPTTTLCNENTPGDEAASSFSDPDNDDDDDENSKTARVNIHHHQKEEETSNSHRRRSTVISMTENTDHEAKKKHRHRSTASGGLFDRLSKELKEFEEAEHRMAEAVIVFALRNVKNLPDASFSYASADPDWYVSAHILEEDDDNAMEESCLTEKSGIRKGDVDGSLDWDPPPSMVFMAPDGNDLMWQGRKLILCLYDKNLSNITTTTVSAPPPTHRDNITSSPSKKCDQTDLDDTHIDRELAYEEEPVVATRVEIANDPDALVAYGVISDLRQYAKLDESSKEPIFTSLEVELVDADNQSTGASIHGDITLLTVDDAVLATSIRTTALVRYDTYEPPQQDIFCSFSLLSSQLQDENNNDETETTDETTTSALSKTKNKRISHTVGLDNWSFVGYLVARDYANPYAQTPIIPKKDLIEHTDMSAISPLAANEIVVENWSMRHNPGQEDEQGFQYAYSLESSRWFPNLGGSSYARRSVWYRVTRHAAPNENMSTLPKDHLAEDNELASRVIDDNTINVDHPDKNLDEYGNDMHAHAIARFTSSQRQRIKKARASILPNDIILSSLRFASLSSHDIILDIGCCGADAQFPMTAVREFGICDARSIVIDDSMASRAEAHVSQVLNTDQQKNESKKVHIFCGDVTKNIHSKDFARAFHDVSLFVLYLSSDSLRLLRPLILRFLLIDHPNDDPKAPELPARRLLSIGIGPQKLTPIRISYLTSAQSSAAVTAHLYDRTSVPEAECRSFLSENKPNPPALRSTVIEEEQSSSAAASSESISLSPLQDLQ